MATTVVPLKVRIGLRLNGHADHPDWTRLPLAQTGPGNSVENAAAQMTFLGGWKYDKTSGHGEETPDSPADMRWGMIFVTEQFALEAEAEFPAFIVRLTDAETVDFWDNKAHAHLDEFRRDDRILDGLKIEHELLILAGGAPAGRISALKAKIRRALDPDDSEPGLRWNVEKTLARRLPKSGIVIQGKAP